MTSSSGPVRAAVVTVGDELLLGRTVDTNAAWLGRELSDLGIPVARRSTVADVAGDIQRAVREALAAVELVVVTGGLGPTPDDLTRDAVAELLDRPLSVDEAVLEEIRERFRARGVQELPEPNRRVAQVPEGALKLTNPVGTAPGLAMDAGHGLVVLLPGVPRELRGIYGADLLPLLRRRFGSRLTPVHVRVIHTTGIPESLLSQQVSKCLPEGPGDIGLAFLPDELGVDLRFTAMDLEAEEAERRFDDLERRLDEVLRPWRFEAPGGDLVEAVRDALLASRRTLAVAESCTGGLVAKRLTDLAGASVFFRGGVVAYANEVKVDVLGVSAAELDGYGAVSEPVARRMAAGVAEALGADAGIGVTGVAGPDGGTDEKPVGTVWYAAALDGRVRVRRARFPGDRRSVRERAAQASLALLLRLLEGRAEADDSSDEDAGSTHDPKGLGG